MTEQKKIAVGISGTGDEKEIKTINPILLQAIEKINSFDTKKLNKKASVIAKPTADALQLFCEQSEEFARAVIDGKNFTDCLNEISKNFGGAVSDFDVYSKAVEFYFPGAKIEFKMVIRMSEYELEESAEIQKTVSLSLDSLLDW